MIRLAAVGDLHVSLRSKKSLAWRFQDVNERADVLLLPGDLTDNGYPDEARLLLRELTEVRIPIVAVLGNHDQCAGKVGEVVQLLTEGGVAVLDGDIYRLEVRGKTLGIVGTKGFQGGFGKNVVAPGFEPAVDVWVREAEAEASKIQHELEGLSTDYRVVMLHYAPIRATVQGEHPEIIPFMGTDRLCEPIDRLGADLVVHGHSHHGTHSGVTPGGIPVYNVAASLLDKPYAVLEVG
ncbi:MAG TPA: metallophosphoesterase [Chloroflexia bacterium]|nr:metallophosphoesterase [Chloroflexia bacterium]